MTQTKTTFLSPSSYRGSPTSALRARVRLRMTQTKTTFLSPSSYRGQLSSSLPSLPLVLSLVALVFLPLSSSSLPVAVFPLLTYSRKRGPPAEPGRQICGLVGLEDSSKRQRCALA
mmetsp:Transcript_26570/g.60613  ORF Transcript_26570/g.60613 Transcript_26570/m.60613 type:complete len:116 (-) Transcript_26570:71-418(-)